MTAKETNRSVAHPSEVGHDRTHVGQEDNARGKAGGRRPRVAVLVDLARRPGAGGHVRFWEQIVAAARVADPGVALSVHFQGAENATERLTDSLQVFTHTPRFSSARVPGLGAMPDHADLAPTQPRLLPFLAQADVIHCTDALFTFARTARRFAGKSRVPLVTSLHTDAVAYAAIYTNVAIRQRLPARARGISMPSWWPFRTSPGDWVAARMARAQARHLQACDWVTEGAGTSPLPVGHTRTSTLRRGLDRQVFTPGCAREARAQLGLPEAAFVVASTGRLSPGKRVDHVAHVTLALREAGIDAHAVFAGDGPLRTSLAERLGPHARFLGQVPQEEVATMLRAADVFVFPSQVEVWPNAVQEALAMGVPVMADANGGGKLIARPGEDGVVVADRMDAWVDAALELASNHERRRTIGRAAAARAQAEVPSWRTVLEEDLVPVWRHVCGDVNPQFALRGNDPLPDEAGTAVPP